ncbi:MAG: DUF5009 domain-containing protein [Paludibacteraceae bacterium]|jgi:predicted acyltransferase|nr:DUF5009 domain-containing protein [Paludibacteraceae bacterium]
MKQKAERLNSLDILRGFDLFLLVGLQPILWRLCETPQTWFGHLLKTQLDHAIWQGFHFWDIVMPLFLFMSGITIPFAFAKYRNKTTKKDSQLWIKITKRFFLLFLLGWIVQGNLLAFDIQKFRIFSNTLQAIAVGYLIATICYLFLKTHWQIILTTTFLSSYWIVFATFGNNDYSPLGNIACLIDNSVLTCFKDGVIWNNEQWTFSKDYTYTWILSSLNFCVTVMLGTFAGILLKSSYTSKNKLKTLTAIGISLVIIGLIISPYHPIIKRLWTSSMTLFSGGICFLLMALFYYMVDIKKWIKLFSWLKIYGMNSIVAYVLYETINFRSIGHSIFYGTEQFLGQYYFALIELTQVGIVFGILLLLYRNKIFIKI